METQEFIPTEEQEEAVEKEREKMNKQRTKRTEADYEKWRLSGLRTH